MPNLVCSAFKRHIGKHLVEHFGKIPWENTALLDIKFTMTPCTGLPAR